MSVTRSALEQAAERLREIAGRQVSTDDAAALMEIRTKLRKMIGVADSLAAIATSKSLGTVELRSTAILLVDADWLPKDAKFELCMQPNEDAVP